MYIPAKEARKILSNKRFFCEIKECGNEFEPSLSSIRKGGGRFCSRSCVAKGTHIKNGGMRGDKNHNWKGGIAKDHYRYKLKQKARYPERIRAREIVHDHIKRGNLIPKPCENCNESKVQAHHDDYSKPLDVRWLCIPHHSEYHGRTVSSHFHDSDSFTPLS